MSSLIILLEQKGSGGKPLRMLITAVVVFFLDMGSKFLVQRLLTPDHRVAVINGVFYLTLVHNPGAAFGLFANRTGFFILVTLVVVGLLLYYSHYYARGQGLLPVAIGLQLGGALGNLVDRVRYGKVVDFLDFQVWPVFNVADMAIVIGVGLFVLVMWRSSPKEAHPSRGSNG